MTRDMDLVRLILLEGENKKLGENPRQLLIKDYDKDIINYHLKIMKDAGLIEALISQTSNGTIALGVLYGLTWEGHEFLDAAKNKNIWNKAKKFVQQKGGTIPFDVLKSLLISLMKELFEIK